MNEDTRTYDIVVFGATGFTGERVARYIATQQATASGQRQWRSKRIAYAGRKESALQDARYRIAKASHNKSVKFIPIIIADVENEDSLKDMASQTKLVISCVGPFRFYGEPVVRACVAAGTHYVDVTGEPEFIERMMVKYHDEAKAKNLLIVPCCGWDSIPADCGAQYAIEAFRQRHRGGVVNAIETFLQIDAPKGTVLHYGTWASAVHGFSSANSLRAMRKDLRKRQTHEGALKLEHTNPRLTVPSRPYFDSRVNAWCVLFPGSDVSVVNNTQFLELEKKQSRTGPVPYYSEYFVLKRFYQLVGLAIMGILLTLLSRFQVGKKFLLKWPRLCSFGLFSHDGPSEEQQETTTFRFQFLTRGYKNAKDAKTGDKAKLVQNVTAVYGPEPGYVATPILVAEAAATVLDDCKSSTEGDGGVLTPAYAFMISRKTKLLQRLVKQGVVFAKQPLRPITKEDWYG